MSEREAKREQFNQKSSSGNKLLIPIVVLVLAVVAGGGWFVFGQSALAGHETVQAGQDGKLLFPAADYADGKAKFYRFEGKSGPIDFFVVRSQDGVVRAAFDTCDVCYRERKGYRQEGNDMVCNNCDQHFRTDLVNVVKGGCNPAPLQRQQVGETIVIAANDIERGIGYFKTAVN
ncbi:MAG: DUF2318 domain-containing protein [Desulfuromonadales bacterium]|nr:DUF2318 domain-containing protein [Desulfuromonadales bacterium]